MTLPIYNIDDIDHNNWYTKFKYVVMAPIAILRFSCLIATYTFTFMLKIFPNWYNNYILRNITIYLFLFSFGMYVTEIKNKNFIKNGIKNNAVTIYNHIAFIDAIIILLLYPFGMVVKSGYSKILEHILDAGDGIIIEKKPNQTQKIIDHVNAKRRCLIIAPEGTVTNGKYLAPFKLGAFAPLHPVQPILIRYIYKYYNPFFSEDPPYLTLYRMLTQFVNFVMIEVLPLEYPRFNESPAEFAERVRTIMADALNVQKV